jgi:hypothetical protein
VPVIQREPPAEVRQVVDAAVEHLAGLPGSLLHTLAREQPGDFARTVPHPVFSLGLSDLTTAPGLEAARPTGWRYLLRQGDRVVASAETVTIPAGRQEFAQINCGPFVASTAAALETADALPETMDRSYEPRLLDVPALHTMALWLHGDRKDDLLIPLDPAPEGIEPNRAYPADELLGILADKASQVPTLDPGDPRGG